MTDHTDKTAPQPATTELSKNLGELNPAPAEGVGEREKLIDDLRHVYSQMTPSGLERMDSDGAAFIIERAIKFLAALSPSPNAELSRPITFQDVRLAVGEGGLTATDVLAGVNAELRRRAALSPSPVEKLVEALERQCDNMAFVVNHAPIIQPWYDKFSSELEEDRQSLAAARQTGEEDIHAAILVALSGLGIGLIAAVIMSFVFMGAGV